MSNSQHPAEESAHVAVNIHFPNSSNPPSTSNVTQQDTEHYACMYMWVSAQTHIHTHNSLAPSVKLSAGISTEGQQWNQQGRCANNPDVHHPTLLLHKWVIKNNTNKQKKKNIHPLSETKGTALSFTILCYCKHTLSAVTCGQSDRVNVTHVTCNSSAHVTS